MRFRSLHKWKTDPTLDGLIFFSQRMDELLFDYTLDSYKPSALNASSLCIEAVNIIKDIEEKLIEPANLNYILSELEWSIRGDKLANSLLDVDLNYYILHNDETSLSEKRKRLEALSKTIGPSRYLEKCKTLLNKYIRLKRKKNIDQLAKNLATTLINIGYSKTYLYKKTLDLFFTGDEPKIDSTDFIEKYFEFFNCKVHYYDALFLVDPLINNISESIKVFNAQVYHDVPEEFTESVKRHQFYKSAEQNKFEYILIKNIKAFDHQTARTRAEINIDNLSDLFSLFYHKSQISWKREAIILRKCCDKSSSLEHPHKGAMEKGFDYKPNKAAKKLNKLIFSLKLDTHSGSFQKFNRVADLHGICISNNIIENQLVNLWTAIETLVPSHVGTSKISAIINFILPFIVVNYIRRIIERFVTDLFLWDKEITKKSLIRYLTLMVLRYMKEP